MIAMVAVVATIWTIQLRKQVVALTDWFDRWEGECDQLLSIDPSQSLKQPLEMSIANSRANILYLRQLYRQQLLTLDRIQSLRSLVSIATAIIKRRFNRRSP
jgi:hypothetical protein